MLFSELTGEPRVCKGNLVDIVMKIVEGFYYFFKKIENLKKYIRM